MSIVGSHCELFFYSYLVLLMDGNLEESFLGIESSLAITLEGN